MAEKTAAKKTVPVTTPAFNYGALLRSLHAGSFREARSPELDIVQQHEAIYGKPPGDPAHSVRVSPRSIFRGPSNRAVTVAGAGAYLVGTTTSGYIPALQQRSLVFQLGANAIPASKSNIALPRGATSATTSFMTGETTVIAESETTFGQIASTPKMLTIFSKVSRLLLLQSNAGQVIAEEQTAAAGAALDASVIGGTGTAGQPTGIISTQGVGSFSGAALNYAAIISAQQSTSDANAILNPFTLGYLTTPTVAGLLKQRYRTSGTNVEIPIWGGPLAGGDIEGVPAFSTRNVPVASMVYGDFSTINVFLWDSVSIEIDPFSSFQNAQIGVRLILPYDVTVSYPQAFSVATGIT